jgi:hypothetical protein
MGSYHYLLSKHFLSFKTKQFLCLLKPIAYSVTFTQVIEIPLAQEAAQKNDLSIWVLIIQ